MARATFLERYFEHFSGKKVLEQSVRSLLPGPTKSFVKSMVKNVPCANSTLRCMILEPTTDLKVGTLPDPLKYLILATFKYT